MSVLAMLEQQVNNELRDVRNKLKEQQELIQKLQNDREEMQHYFFSILQRYKADTHGFNEILIHTQKIVKECRLLMKDSKTEKSKPTKVKKKANSP